MKQPTEEQERAYIGKHWNLEQIQSEIGHVKGRREKMRRLEYECAYYATETSSIKEAAKHAVFSASKFALCTIPGSVLYSLGHEAYSAAMCGDVKSAVVLAIPGVMFWAPAAVGLKYGLFGCHPVSAYGNYYSKPWFGAIDNLRFSANWLHIYTAQCMGNIRKGTQTLAKDDGLDFFHGGP